MAAAKRSCRAKPDWLKRHLPTGPGYERVRRLLRDCEVTTVCQEARCPNQYECFGKGTATFMILGAQCTRNCGFCAVGHGRTALPDPEEPGRVAEAVAKMGLRFVVVTSVTRDDLPDGGASIFAETIRAIKKEQPGTGVEVLIPDLQGKWSGLEAIVAAGPDVVGHNMETVARLYPSVRPGAVYARSLDLLKTVKRIDANIPTKTGIMLGLGESASEYSATLDDLVNAGCDILTVGQYLQPSPCHLPVQRFVPPDTFRRYQETGVEQGFLAVAAGPLVRSSYQAERLYREVREKESKKENGNSTRQQLF